MFVYKRNASGKPSTWLPPAGLVERYRPKYTIKNNRTKKKTNQCYETFFAKKTQEQKYVLHKNIQTRKLKTIQSIAINHLK